MNFHLKYKLRLEIYFRNLKDTPRYVILSNKTYLITILSAYLAKIGSIDKKRKAEMLLLKRCGKSKRKVGY